MARPRTGPSNDAYHHRSHILTPPSSGDTFCTSAGMHRYLRTSAEASSGRTESSPRGPGRVLQFEFPTCNVVYTMRRWHDSACGPSMTIPQAEPSADGRTWSVAAAAVAKQILRPAKRCFRAVTTSMRDHASDFCLGHRQSFRSATELIHRHYRCHPMACALLISSVSLWHAERCLPIKTPSSPHSRYRMSYKHSISHTVRRQTNIRI